MTATAAVQAPVPADVIAKGIPTAGLLAHLLVAKFVDHLGRCSGTKLSSRALAT
jgi:transposase